MDKRGNVEIVPNEKLYHSFHALRFHIEWKHGDRVNDMVKTKVQEVYDVPDGLHLATITELETRKTDQYGDYLDIKMVLEDIKGAPMNLSVPLNASVKSQLGEILMAVGFPVADKVGKDIDLDKILIGKKITFQTHKKKVTNKDGRTMEFTNVLKDTIKSAEKQ